MPPKIELANIDDLATRYLAGEPLNKLTSEISVDRQTLRCRLVEHGVTIRTQSEQERIKWSTASPAKRRRQTMAANNAARGSMRTIDTKIKSANTRESIAIITSEIEQQLFDLLTIKVIPQKAIGIYNVDFAVDELPIAIEVFGGHWHAYGNHAARHIKRFKYILNKGWTTVIIWHCNRSHPIDMGAAQYVTNLANIFRSDPPTISEYRVILGDGQLAPSRQSYLNTRSIIKSLGRTAQLAG